jgi:ABC-type sulfate transport system permease component
MGTLSSVLIIVGIVAVAVMVLAVALAWWLLRDDNPPSSRPGRFDD